MKKTIFILVLVLILFLPVSYRFQESNVNLPEGWMYKELKFPEGSVLIPAPKVPKDDEWSRIIMDEFKPNDKMITFVVGEGFSVHIKAQFSEMTDPNFTDQMISLIEKICVNSVIDEFLPDPVETFGDRLYYVGYNISKEGKKSFQCTSFILLGTMLYSIDIYSSQATEKTLNTCRLIAAYAYSPNETPNYYYNPVRSVELNFSNPGSGLREIYPWNLKDGELLFSGGESGKDYYNDLRIIYHDCSVSVKAKFNEDIIDKPIGLIFGNDKGKCYYFLISKDGAYSLIKYTSKLEPVSPAAKIDLDEDDFNELKVKCIGKRIKCYINDKLVVNVIEDSYNGGRVGLYAIAGTDCSFDDFKVDINVKDNDEEDDAINKVVVEEHFDSDETDFGLSELWKLKNGLLTCSNGEKDSIHRTRISDEYEDCIILVKARWDGRAKNTGFGIQFGRSDEEYFMFRISPDGNYQLCHYDGSKWNDLIPWKDTDVIRNGFNDLKVICSGKNVYAYINNNLVVNVKIEYYDGGGVGLVCSGNLDASFDDFIVEVPN